MAYGYRQGAGIAETNDAANTTLPACTLAAPPSGSLVAMVGWTDGGGGAGLVQMPAGWIRLAGAPDGGTCDNDWWWLPAAGAANQSTVFTLTAARFKLAISIVEYPSSRVLIAPAPTILEPQVTTKLLPSITPTAGLPVGIIAGSTVLFGQVMTGLPPGYTKRLETFALGASNAMHAILTQDAPAASGSYGGTETFADVVRWAGGQMALTPAGGAGFRGEPGGGVW